MERDSSRAKILGAGAMLAVAVLISMLRHAEMSGESWGFWFFSRIFAETGELLSPSRSPIYILYLQAFRWLGYPTAVYFEYFVTMFLTVASLMLLMKPYVGNKTAVFTAVLWIPFIQIAEPPIQRLALVSGILGLWFRRSPGAGRNALSASYACLLLAYLFRPNFLLLAAMFALLDVWRLRRHRAAVSWGWVKPVPADVFLFVVLVLTVWIRTAPRSFLGNNYLASTPTWFPTDSKSVGDGAILGAMDDNYIEKKYGSFRDKDWYFINQEIFGERGSTVLGAVKANPKFVVYHLLKNTVDFFPAVLARTQFFPLFEAWQGPGKWVSEWRLVIRQRQTSHIVPALQGLLAHVVAPIFVFGLLWGAWWASDSVETRLFVAASFLSAAATIMVIIRARTLVPLLPILPLSAVWYGRKLEQWIARASWSASFKPLCCPLAVPLMIFVLSNGSDWRFVLADAAASLRSGRFTLLQNDDYSMKAGMSDIALMTPRCHGVMSLERNFWGAFIDLPISSFHDVWEVPPFGKYGHSDYDGLRPDRIDCLFISHELTTGIGLATNYQIRYDNYIRPYAEKLRAAGWKSVVVAGGVEAIVPPARR